MTKVKNYLSLIKFSHTIFAMPFALIGFFLGYFSLEESIDTKWGRFEMPDLEFKAIGEKEYYLIRFVLVILCMIFARSSAMAFNRYLDASFDARNPRTAVREIPAGVLNPRSVLFFTVINSVLFMASSFFINKVCFLLSPVALFVILFYSYTKRFTFLCHLVLGLGLSLAPIGAYLAITGYFSLLPVLFSIAVLCWVSGFDIIYALQDESFDKANRLHSIPASVGGTKALRISELLHVLSAGAVISAGLLGHFGIWYWMGAVFFCGLLIYQHLLVKPKDLSKVNMAFFTTNGIASVIFAVFVIMDLFLNPG
ncbi:MAG: UbiA family prenyltransferase [Chitinophagaceae bacterium]|nr:UbiA family prenyltransferase [Chitinophagaceae bacterium]